MRAPASSLELDLPLVRGALGEYGGAEKSGTVKDERKRLLSNSQVDVPWRKKMPDWGTCDVEKVE